MTSFGTSWFAVRSPVGSPSTLEALAGLVVAAFGVALLALAVTIWILPERAARFLESFASTARAHYVEQVARLVFGAALIGSAPRMACTAFFTVLGWLVLVTAVGLLLTPWRWHQRFGRWAIPLVVRHLRLYGLASAGLGAFLLYGVSRTLLS